MDIFTKGFAFIVEGETEKVFYISFLEYIVASASDIEFVKMVGEDGETYFIYTSPNKKIIIKFFVVGTISQITNSGSWFENKCSKKMKMLYRSCGLTYHEGERALSLIQALDFEQIMEKGPIDLSGLKQHLLE